MFLNTNGSAVKMNKEQTRFINQCAAYNALSVGRGLDVDPESKDTIVRKLDLVMDFLTYSRFSALTMFGVTNEDGLEEVFKAYDDIMDLVLNVKEIIESDDKEVQPLSPSNFKHRRDSSDREWEMFSSMKVPNSVTTASGRVIDLKPETEKEILAVEEEEDNDDEQEDTVIV